MYIREVHLPPARQDVSEARMRFENDIASTLVALRPVIQRTNYHDVTLMRPYEWPRARQNAPSRIRDQPLAAREIVFRSFMICAGRMPPRPTIEIYEEED